MISFKNKKYVYNFSFKNYLLISSFVFAINSFSQKLDIDFDCSFIKTEIDKFNGDKKYTYRHSLYLSNFNITATKIISLNDSLRPDTGYFLVINSLCRYINKEAKGVYFLFSDNAKIAYPNHPLDIEFKPGYLIDSNYTNSTYNYVATVRMDKQLFEKVMNFDITDVKLYTEAQNFAGWREEKQNKLMRKALNCMKLM